MNGYKNELVAGLTTAFALVPESIAFAFVLGVDPMIGLYTSFILGIVIALFGGRPASISGAAGSVAVVFAPLVALYGVEYLFLAVLVMGIIQIILGILNFNKFAKVIPKAVMLGFVNGLAIVILKSQLELFKYNDVLIQGSTLYWTIILVVLTMLIIWFVPKINSKIPVQLLAILIVTTITIILRMVDVDLLTVEDFAHKKLSGGLPKLHLMQIDNMLQAILVVLPFAFIAAFVGIIESILTLNLVSDRTKTSGNTKRECIALGFANVVCSLFGTMGGCAMVGQTVVNINAGGRKYVSSATCAIVILGFIVFIPGVIAIIPLAVLIGIMFMVVYETFAWETIYLSSYIKKNDMFIVVLTTLITIFVNLGVAVIIGVITSSLIFVWQKAETIKINLSSENDDQVEYQLDGVLFFGSVENVKQAIKLNDKNIFLDFTHCRIQDYAGVNFLVELDEILIEHQLKLCLKNLSIDAKQKIEDHSKKQLNIK